MKKAVVLLLTLATVSVGVWLFLVPWLRSPVEAPRDPSPADTPAEMAVSTSLTGGDTQPERVMLEGGGRPGETPPQWPVLPVQVVFMETGLPAPGAEVIHFDPAFNYNLLTPAEQDESHRLQNDREAHTRRFGNSVFADDEGMARVPWNGEWSTVHGILGDHRGNATYQVVDGTPPLRLELFSEQRVTFEVNDESGQSVEGITVWLHAAAIDAEGVEQELSVGFVRTDAEGGAVLPVTSRLMGLERSGFSLTSGRPRAVYHGGHVDGPVLDLDDLPDEPVTLVVPVLGSVLFEIADAHGRPPTSRGWIDISPFNTQVRFDTRGQARLDHIAPGQALQYRARSGRAELSGTVQGPGTGGQEVLVRLQLPADMPVLSGRIVTPSFEPVAMRRFQIGYEYRGGGGGGFFDTDGEGVFRIPLDSSVAGSRLRWVTIDQTPNPTMAPGQTLGRGAYIGPEGLTDWEQGLGDVVVDLLPLVAHVRLVEADDRPASGRVSLDLRSWQEDRRESDWRPETRVGIWSLGGNEYQFRGHPLGSRFRLRVQSEDYVPIEPVEFGAGEDLRIELYRGGDLRATLLTGLEQEPSKGSLYALLAPDDGRPPPTQRVAERLRGERDGWSEGIVRFGWEAVPPGTYSLSIRTHSSPDPLVTVPGVVVTDGERTDDPRLEGIDLSGRLRYVEITVRDPDGAPEDAAVLVLGSGQGVEMLGVSGWRTKLLLARPSVDVLVVAKGFLPETLFGVSSDSLVRLRDPLTVSVQLAGGFPELPRGARITLSAVLDQASRDLRPFLIDTDRRTPSSGALQELRGRTTISIALVDGIPNAIRFFQTGSYELRVRVRHNGRIGILQQVQPAELLVHEGLTSLRIALSHDEIRAVLARLGR